MSTIIAFLVIALGIAGLLLIVTPSLIVDFLVDNARNTRLRLFAIGGRVLVGIALLLLASGSRFPYTIGFIGALAIVAAIVIAVVPKDDADEFVTRVSQLPSLFLRFSGILSWVLAGFLVYAVL